MGVSVRSLLFDKGEYLMKLSQKKWKSLISGVLLAASASSFLIAPVYAADYSKQASHRHAKKRQRDTESRW